MHRTSITDSHKNTKQTWTKHCTELTANTANNFPCRTTCAPYDFVTSHWTSHNSNASHGLWQTRTVPTIDCQGETPFLSSFYKRGKTLHVSPTFHLSCNTPNLFLSFFFLRFFKKNLTPNEKALIPGLSPFCPISCSLIGNRCEWRASGVVREAKHAAFSNTSNVIKSGACSRFSNCCRHYQRLWRFYHGMKTFCLGEGDNRSLLAYFSTGRFLAVLIGRNSLYAVPKSVK